MAGELTKAVEAMMASYEKMDFDALSKTVTEDSQGIDELSRRWMRTQQALEDYFRKVSAAVTNIHNSKLNDIHESIHGDVGIVTGWLEQDYVLDGRPQHISAPTTVVLRREGGRWKIALFHSLPLPEAG
jgi:ketosteroid isomerase-like protein